MTGSVGLLFGLAFLLWVWPWLLGFGVAAAGVCWLPRWDRRTTWFSGLGTSF